MSVTIKAQIYHNSCSIGKIMCILKNLIFIIIAKHNPEVRIRSHTYICGVSYMDIYYTVLWNIASIYL